MMTILLSLFVCLLSLVVVLFVCFCFLVLCWWDFFSFIEGSSSLDLTVCLFACLVKVDNTGFPTAIPDGPSIPPVGKSNF